MVMQSFLHYRMDLNAMEENYRQKNRTCFILGASGETGKALLKEIVEHNIFSKITLIGRRQLTFEDKAYENLVMCQVLFMYSSPKRISLHCVTKDLRPEFKFANAI